MKNLLTILILLLAANLTRAQVKISALPAASTLTGSELVPMVQGGVTVQASIFSIISNQLAVTFGPVTATSFAGDGVSLVNLSASAVRYGTINDARLSGNVPRLDSINNFQAAISAPSFAGDGSQLTNLQSGNVVLLQTNLTSTNLVSTPFFVTLSSNATYTVTVRACMTGFAATDHPGLYAFCTNSVSGGNEWGFAGQIFSQAINYSYGYDEVSAGGYPYPLSSSGSGFPVGNGFQRLGFIQNAAGQLNSQNASALGTMLLQVTNAPVNVFFITSNENGKTTTNTLKAGSYISYQMVSQH